MKRLRQIDFIQAQSIMAFARCACGACTCRYCNVLIASPHEVEVGSNSVSAMVRAGYFK